MTNLDSILKSRDITLRTKVHLVKAMVFLLVMYGCESWTVKKAEHRRIDAFELWCWWRLLRVPWTARRSNQSILKAISPGCSLEELMLKLKLQAVRRTDGKGPWGDIAVVTLRKVPESTYLVPVIISYQTYHSLSRRMKSFSRNFRKALSIVWRPS